MFVSLVRVLLLILITEKPAYDSAKEAFQKAFVTERDEVLAIGGAPPEPFFAEIIPSVNKRYLELMGDWLSSQERRV